MGEWIKDRRNALIDAALVYAAAEWLGPAIVSTVIYLGSSNGGVAVLFLIGYPLLLVGAFLLAAHLEAKLGVPSSEAPDDGEWTRVWVRGYPMGMPFGMKAYGSWVRVRVNSDEAA